MIYLLSLITGLLMLCSTAALAQSPQPIFQIPQEQQDSDAERKRLTELLEKAQYIEFHFVGNRIFPEQTLFDQMKLLPDPDRSGSLRQPDGSAYWDKLQDDLERVRFFLGTQGYPQARTGEPRI